MGTKRLRRNGSTTFGWFGAAVAPWAAGIGILISFTAVAGTESSIGSGILSRHDGRIAPALPADSPLIGAVEFRSGHRLRIGEAPLRETLKDGATMFPVALREGKRDESSLMGRRLERGARALRRESSSILALAALGSVTGIISPGPTDWNPDLEPDGFIAVPDLGLGRAPGADTSDDALVDSDDLEHSDGSTPAVPKAVALSSVTPAAADAIPVEIVASSLAIPGFSPRRDRLPAMTGPVQQHPSEALGNRFADLIEPETMDREQRCLAEAVYFEARSEPEEGQAAVAQVVLNRVKSGLYPSSVCGVVYQNRHRYMGCQFSFACEGKSLRITDAASWQTATNVASAVIDGRTYLSEVGDATHYHAAYVKPGWSRRLKKMDVIGRHIFYQLKRGQT